MQRYFTKCLKGTYNSLYRERLCNLALDSLEIRRLQSGLTMCFKIILGFYDLNVIDFVTFNNSRLTRKISLTLAANWRTAFESNLFRDR